GLFRVRAFTQDDCHTYCTVEQIEGEILAIIQIAQVMLSRYGFNELDIAVSTKPAKALGTDEVWAQATAALENALKQANLPYRIQPGEGAFYGPKIEFKIKDSLGREWQCGTIQVDFFQPENFDLSYVSAEGKRERPVIIHHVIYGSLERFLGILLEHHKGWLPFALAPVQIRVLTITDRQQAYATEIVQQLKAANLRAELDESSDPLSGKIKTAQLDRVPWMLIVGDKEQAQQSVTLRPHVGAQQPNLTISDLITLAHKQLKSAVSTPQ
ncbi:MAG TPA: threonine--tRNA ligase, partial [Candidatus Babeliales bacterium]|nr:threonine--tRNA ligase [Candidatus Babeliales bacterium]